MGSYHNQIEYYQWTDFYNVANGTYNQKTSNTFAMAVDYSALGTPAPTPTP